MIKASMKIFTDFLKKGPSVGTLFGLSILALYGTLNAYFKEARYKIIQNDGFSRKKSHTNISLW